MADLLLDPGLWFLAGIAIGMGWRRLTRRHDDSHDARQRRVGWGYGYGAGVVDGKHGQYRPFAPHDGRTRRG